MFKIQSNVVYSNSTPVFAGEFKECEAFILKSFKEGSVPAPIAIDTVPSVTSTSLRKGLDMRKGRLYRRDDGKWCAWHPDYNHPQYKHSMLVGSEEACRKVLGLPPVQPKNAAVEAIRQALQSDIESIA